MRAQVTRKPIDLSERAQAKPSPPREVYESERPSEGEAFREGDIRFINMAKDK